MLRWVYKNISALCGSIYNSIALIVFTNGILSLKASLRSRSRSVLPICPQCTLRVHSNFKVFKSILSYFMYGVRYGSRFYFLTISHSITPTLKWFSLLYFILLPPFSSHHILIDDVYGDLTLYL